MSQLLRPTLFGLFLCTCFFASYSQLTDQLVKKEDNQSSKPLEFDSPLTKLVNKPKVADAYPFLSGDGLRLYFTTNREGGHGRFYISTRNSIKEAFGEAVPLSKNLTDGYYAGSLTADELTLCMVRSGKMYISTRRDMRSEFGIPVLVEGIPEQYHFGPAISPDGKEIIVMTRNSGNGAVTIYKRSGDEANTRFKEAGELPIPEGSDPGPGQFSKDGLSYYFSFENKKREVAIWRYTRTSLNDKFVDLEELPVKINALKRNFQPTVNADASIIIHVTSQTNLWEEDDIVLVNDPAKTLTAAEQFATVTKNEVNNLTVKTKVNTSQVRTFPNPFQTQVILEMDQVPAAGTVFTLYDLTGKMIKQQQVVNVRTSIELGNLPAATYIYQVVDNKKSLVASGKLVKG